jgi:hypothetical protein
MGREFDIPWVRTSKYNRQGFDITWLGSKYQRQGVQYTMGREIDIPWVEGSKYHE